MAKEQLELNTTTEQEMQTGKDWEAEAKRLKAKMKAMEDEQRQKEEAEKAAAEAAEKLKSDPRRLVEIEVPSGKGKDVYPLYVNVNDENYMIPRDKRVTVPYFVYLSIVESQKQDKKAANMIRMLEEDYKRNARAAGV